MYAANAVCTDGSTVFRPPSTTIRPGSSRSSSARVAAGRVLVFVNRIGAPRSPATGPAASASGNTFPDATYATGTPGAKWDAEMFAAASYRSTPPIRVIVGEFGNPARAISTDPVGTAGTTATSAAGPPPTVGPPSGRDSGCESSSGSGVGGTDAGAASALGARTSPVAARTAQIVIDRRRARTKISPPSQRMALNLPSTAGPATGTAGVRVTSRSRRPRRPAACARAGRGPTQHTSLHLQDRNRSEGLEDVLDPVLGVAEEHLGVVAEEQRVLDAGVAGGH